MNHKLRHITIIVFAGALLGVAAFMVFVPSIQKNGSETADSDGFGIVSGLSADDSVSYKILPEAGEPIIGEFSVDEHDEFKIPLFKSEANKDVLYNLEIMKSGKPLNLSFRVKPEDKSVQIYGTGVEKFSDIKVKGLDEETQTKSDWSGAFNIAQDIENLKSFRVALFDNNVLSDARDMNPLMIEVLETAGGGGPDATGVNVFSNSPGCERPQMSICRLGRVQAQIDRVKAKYVGSLMSMTEQLSATAMYYTKIIGTFFDAKMQMQTQRQLQLMQAQAHKDYHPSEQMCVFGTFVKSVATVEEKARHERQAFNKIMMERYANADLPDGYQGDFVDLESRLKQFRSTYCDPTDHNNALGAFCEHRDSGGALLIGGQDAERLNRDVDYARLADSPMTLNVDFSDNVLSPEEEDIIALARNLYWQEILPIVKPGDLSSKTNELDSDYMEARRLMAMHNVSHNTLGHIMSMKAQAPEGIAADSGWSFMKAFMREFGLTDTQIADTLGERPSYYAQMDVLTKKMYQDPEFYINLYDKPVNVNRISASMDAIKLMQMRDWFHTAARREMLSSLLLESSLTGYVAKKNDKFSNLTAE